MCNNNKSKNFTGFTPVKYFQRKSSIKDRNFTGFTLIELLIVIGIIAILAAAVIIAINPGQQFAQARDATRESHINALQNAILSYQVDNHGTLPAEVKDNPGAEICNLQALAEGESCPAGTIDLSPLVPEYISSLPINPSHEPTDPDIGYGIASVENEFTIWPTESETRLVGRRPALKFDGSDDYVDAGSGTSLDITNEITMAAWIKPNSDGQILRKGWSDYWVWKFEFNSGQYISGRVSTVNNYPIIRGDSVLSYKKWHHAAITYDGSYLRLYVNGNLDAEPISLSGDINTNSRSLEFADGDPYASFFGGKINDIRIYDRALTGNEVKALYNGQNITNGLAGHWPLNEGQGCTVYDQSGNGNDGTLQPNCPDNNPEWVIGN